MNTRVALLPVTITLVLTLGACASAPPRWYLNGNSQQQFQADYQRCSQSAEELTEAGAQGASQISQQSNAYNYKAAGGASLLALMVTASLAQDALASCLRQAGYTPAK